MGGPRIDPVRRAALLPVRNVIAELPQLGDAVARGPWTYGPGPCRSPRPTKKLTVSQENAVEKAADYLDYAAFSRSGLIKQLKYEGFSTTDATFGVDAQKANWNEQAAKKAKEYVDYSSLSHSGLIKQLKYEGFTAAQATYGAKKVGL
jgi:hypothetical protein